MRLLEDLDGFGTGNWKTFRTTIEVLYPKFTTCYTIIYLEDSVDISAMSHMRNKEYVMLYYCRFLQTSTPLYDSKLTDYQRNAEVFAGFHIKDKDILSRRLEVLELDQPIVHGDLQDVLKLLDFVSPPDTTPSFSEAVPVMPLSAFETTI